jgi:steroid delta-isomerase-like uncharacterized protein
MSEENKALVRRYFEEIWDKGNLELVDELFTTNFVRHGPTGTEGEVRGLEGFKGVVSMYRSAFPDLQVPIEDLIAEGDRVVTRWRARGTHQGETEDLGPPTGNQASVTGIIVDRISGGKIEEEWVDYDTLHLMQQIGGVSQPG